MKSFTRKIKNVVALILSISFLFGLGISANAYYYSDIPEDFWALDEVNYVSDNGYMTGTSTEIFSPNVALTRAMMVTVLYRYAGSPSATTSTGFSDVASTAYYAKAVSWAVANNIVTGTGEGTFLPNNTITREDAMVILYRYAVSQDHDISYSTTITGYSDYSSVSSYAITALKWAVAADLLPNVTSTTLSPKGTFSRTDVAVSITRYGTNIIRLNAESDLYDFINGYSIFTNDNYYMTAAHLEKIQWAVYAYYRTNVSAAEGVNKAITDEQQKEWGGSCYGMAATVALDKMGKIDLNGNFAPSADTLHDITSIRGTSVESAINYYQLSQYVAYYGSTANSIAGDVTLAVNTIKNTVGICQMGFNWREGFSSKGHAILVQGASTSGDVHTLTIYNPNTGGIGTATLTSGGILTIDDDTYTLTNINIRSDFDIFDNFDIDGYTNDYYAGIVENTSLSSLDLSSVDYSRLTIALEGPFVITNQEGQTLSWDGSVLGGDMEVHTSWFTTDGPESVSNIIIYVPFSPSFQYEASEKTKKTHFSVADSNGYARANGTNIDQIVICDAMSISIIGEDIAYEIAHGGNSASDPLIIVSDYAEHEIFAQATSNSIYLSTISDNCFVKTIEKTGTTELRLSPFEQGGTISVSTLGSNTSISVR